MVDRFRAKLAVLKAKSVMCPCVRRGILRHLRTGLHHAGHVVHLLKRIAASCTGVSRRCQLHCQEGGDEEPGKP